jgi:hypothetical protein
MRGGGGGAGGGGGWEQEVSLGVIIGFIAYIDKPIKLMGIFI